MSILYVCDGCDVRAAAKTGQLPDPWKFYQHYKPTSPHGQFFLHACANPECQTKVAAMTEPPLTLPH